MSGGVCVICVAWLRASAFASQGDVPLMRRLAVLCVAIVPCGASPSWRRLAFYAARSRKKKGIGFRHFHLLNLCVGGHALRLMLAHCESQRAEKGFLIRG